jgi:hypothetical protein
MQFQMLELVTHLPQRSQKTLLLGLALTQRDNTMHDFSMANIQSQCAANDDATRYSNPV